MLLTPMLGSGKRAGGCGETGQHGVVMGDGSSRALNFGGPGASLGKKFYSSCTQCIIVFVTIRHTTPYYSTSS
ncbi:hypothetical protein [Azospirillum halopraeferens]|uniref:hypothetical protein n=1 Tax=Azospirillum halopraeferens TaxID=34010 RepID=UPI0012ECAE3D|nr:hypothetical protein [Azospirillum halopraeferens]